MITVQMGDDNAVNVKQADIEMLHRNQGGGPTIQKKAGILGFHKNTGLEAAATAKGIPAAKKFYLNVFQPGTPW